MDDEFVKVGRALDVSVTLDARLAPWPGQDVWQVEALQRMDRGDVCNVSAIRVSCHAGTHVDAPWHFGMSPKTIEALALDQLIVPARVVDLTHVPRGAGITRADLEGRVDGAPAVLCRTVNSGVLASGAPFDTEYVYLTADASEYLVACGVRTVGVDYLSVEGFHQSAPVAHQALLGNDVVIVEGLDLTKAGAGDYLLVVLPLRIAGVDGSPARAVLLS